MVSIREKMQNINTEKKTEIRNVAELVTLNIDTEIETRTFAEGTEKEFRVDGFEQEGKFYRVPYSVQKQIAVLLEEVPDLKIVKIKKVGSGLDTSYMVMPF